MANFISYGDPGLFDEFVQNLDVAAFETPLMRVGKIVQWEVLEPALKAAVTTEPKGPGGRPRFHRLLMFSRCSCSSASTAWPMMPPASRSPTAKAFAPFWA